MSASAVRRTYRTLFPSLCPSRTLGVSAASVAAALARSAIMACNAPSTRSVVRSASVMLLIMLALPVPAFPRLCAILGADKRRGIGRVRDHLNHLVRGILARVAEVIRATGAAAVVHARTVWPSPLVAGDPDQGEAMS